MGKRKKEFENVDFKPQSYFRLLAYSKPYWGRMTVGILAGFVVGGSLFGSMLMVPQMMMAVEKSRPATTAELKVEENKLATEIVETVEKKKNESTAEKVEAVDELDILAQRDAKLAKELKRIRGYAEKYDLPIIVASDSIT